jgi:hypothetical protein
MATAAAASGQLASCGAYQPLANSSLVAERCDPSGSLYFTNVNRRFQRMPRGKPPFSLSTVSHTSTALPTT